MIQSFADPTVADLFSERTTPQARRVPEQLCRPVQRKLKALDVAARLDDLGIPVGSRPERLRGPRSGQRSLRVNDQYDLTFRWENGHAYEVGIDSHH